jgi:hypothetical protein
MEIWRKVTDCPISEKNSTGEGRIRDSDAACFDYPPPLWRGTMRKLVWIFTAVMYMVLRAAAPYPFSMTLQQAVSAENLAKLFR